MQVKRATGVTAAPGGAPTRGAYRCTSIRIGNRFAREILLDCRLSLRLSIADSPRYSAEDGAFSALKSSPSDAMFLVMTEELKKLLEAARNRPR